MRIIVRFLEWLDRLPPRSIWDNKRLRIFEGYYIPEFLRYHKLTPEEWKMLRLLEENKICSDCHLRLWTCPCNLDMADFEPIKT
jgi:hypothetical protein